MNHKLEIEFADKFVNEMYQIYCTAMKNTFFNSKKLSIQQSMILFHSGSTNERNIDYYYSIKKSGLVEISENNKIIFSVNIISGYSSFINGAGLFKEKRTRIIGRKFGEDTICTIPTDYTEEEFFQDMLILSNNEIRIKILYTYLNKYFDNNNIRLSLPYYLTLLECSV